MAWLRSGRLRGRWRVVFPWAPFAALATAGVGGCEKRPPDSAPKVPEARRVRFVEVTDAAGIRHHHRRPTLDHKLDNIMPWVCSVGAAAAAGDYNRDGWMDLYVTSSDKGEANRLYRNNKDGTFTDVAAAAGLADVNGADGVSMDCIWGDVDNDGWDDLYLVRWGRSSLFHNNGDGTFTEVTKTLFRTADGSTGAAWANGNAAVFLDFNLDGRLDIYVGNYFDNIDLWNLKTTRIMHDSFEQARNAGRNALFRQEKDGTFRDVAAELGVDDPGWTLAVGSADVNNDGWPDLYSADDFGPDQLFLNDGHGEFQNVSAAVLGKDTKKGMNVDFGDFDNDGWLDIYVANITTAEYLQEGNMLWHNEGVGDAGLTMTDVALETGTYDGGWGWGAKFLDYDSDGDLDILAVNGFISAGEGNYWYDLASWTVTGSDPADAANWPAIGERSFSGYEKTRLWRNEGLSAFTECAAEAGVASDRDGRGLVCFDYDNDGDLDLFFANHNQPPQLFRNDGAPAGHWLMLDLQAEPSLTSSDPHAAPESPGMAISGLLRATETVNRSAIGTRVTIATTTGRQVRERDGGNGFCGQSDPRLHFGLGEEAQVALLEVRWPDGGLQYLENVKPDQLITIHRDPAAYAAEAAIRVGPANVRAREEPIAPPEPRVEPRELNRILEQMEQLLEQSGDYHSASRYRAVCAANGQHDRAITFFERRVNARPDEANLRIELACAYIDKIPTCGGMAAVVCKGSLAKTSLNHLDVVLQAEPNSWVASYCRAMNHLHWPRALRHSDDSATDYRHCVDLALASPGPLPPYVLRAYVGLGDALAKGGRHKEARKAWRDGTERFPKSQELAQRLEITDDEELLSFVEQRRSLERPIDTDLSFLDK